jgi:hypothetical protein
MFESYYFMLLKSNISLALFRIIVYYNGFYWKQMGREGYCWHPISIGQKCCPKSYNKKDGPPQERSMWPKMRLVSLIRNTSLLKL